ncbi:hypothetical protein Cgig2_018362 [Carnegiea gigantea]|uniref:Uncharacterized protein n=1 Tax=Carnegiea gigantea TaxID=171969 RepID=A0A9Q1JQ79_9CARY|nr:hypothetical protein Cgig2_018362 [Carnegiea gigantea]
MNPAVPSTLPTRHSGGGAWVYAPLFWGMRVNVSPIFAQIGIMGRQWRKKAVERLLHRRRVWYTRHPSMADLMGTEFLLAYSSAKAESTDASHAAYAPLRWRRLGVHAFVIMVLYFPTWIGFGGLEGQRRKKAVSRLIRRRHVLHTHHPSIADMMVEICF